VHLKQIEEARALASPVGWGVTALDKSPAFVVQYVPENGSGGTAATCVVVTATGITLDVDDTTIVDGSADSCGTNGDGVFLFSAYTTIGALVDGINASAGGSFRAYIAASLRATASDDLLLAADASCIGANGMTVYFDNSANVDLNAVISGEKFVNNGPGGWMTDADGMCENYMISARIGLEFATNGGGTIAIHSCSQSSDGTEIFSGALTDATTTGINEFGVDRGPDNPLIRSTTGQRLVIIAADDDTDDVEGLTVYTVSGKTAVLRNTHIVDSINH